MRETHLMLISVVVAVSTVGCNTSTSTSDSPLDAFTLFAAKVQSELPRVLSVSKLSEPVSFDVQKTDSLVSPFTAHLTFAYSDEYKGDRQHSILTQNIRADYAYQEDQWVCKQIVLTSGDLQFVSGDRYFFDQLKKQWVGRTIMKLETADIASSEDEIAKLLRSCK